MTEFGSPKGASTDPSQIVGNATKEQAELLPQKDVVLDPTSSIGSLTELGWPDRDDITRLARIDLDNGRVIEVLAHRDNTGRVANYYLAPLKPYTVGEEVVFRIDQNNMFAFADGVRFGRDKSQVRNDKTPVEIDVDLGDLGLRMGSSVSREQFAITVEESGLKLSNIAAEGSPSKMVIDRMVVQAPEEDVNTTVPNQNKKLVALPPPTVMAQLAKPPELVAKEAEERLDDAEEAVAEALGVDISTDNADDVIPRAAESARRIVIQQQIADLKAGENFTPVIVPIQQKAEAVQVSNDVVEEEPIVEAEEEKEQEKTPEEVMREACASPQSLMEALNDPETPPELKRAVQDLVKAGRESASADETSEVWESEIKPLIRKIGGEEAQNVERSLQSVIGTVTEQRDAIVNSSRHLEDASHERSGEQMADLLSRIINSSSQMGSELHSSRFKEAASGALGDQRVAAMRAMISEEDIGRIGKKLDVKLFDAPTIEELGGLYAANGDAIRQGLEGVKVVAQQVRAQTEEITPNWRGRRSRIQDLFAMVTSVSRSSTIDSRTSAETALGNDLELTQDVARKMLRMVQEVGMPSQRNLQEFQNKLDQVASQYDGLFGDLEEIRKLARHVANIASEIK